MKRRKTVKKALIMAAVVCALAALCITAYAKDFLGLRSFLIPASQEQTLYEDVQYPEDDAQAAPVGSPQGGILSLQGYADSPESKAAAEWLEFRNSYDPDGSIVASIGNGPAGVDHKYDLYLIYTQEMADKLDEITGKYGLGLHTRMEILSHDELAGYVGGEFFDSRNGKNYGYMYEDGTFSTDGDYYPESGGEIPYQLMRCVQGTFTDVLLYIADVSEFTEWTYEADGTTLVLAMSPSRCIVIADLGGAFVTVNVLAGTDEITRELLEELAGSIYWDVLADVKTPEFPALPDSETSGTWNHYDQVLDNSYDKYGDTLIYTLYDMDGDGDEELLVREWVSDDDCKWAFYTHSDGKVIRLEDTLYAADSSLWACEDGGIYNVYGEVVYRVEMNGTRLRATVVFQGTTAAPPSDEPLRFAYVLDRSLLYGDGSTAFTVIQSWLNYGGSASTSAAGMQEAYAAALKNLLRNRILPDGSRIGDADADMTQDQFAVFDVDGDGEDELMILQCAGVTAEYAGYVLLYDEASGSLQTEFIEYPMLTFYDNGIIMAGASHNQGWSGDFWPYTMYRYDAASDSYIYIGTVSAWSKAVTDSIISSILAEDPDADVILYPEELDTSGTGFLYYLPSENGDGSTDPVDESVYKEWLNSYIGGATIFQIPFVSLTEENIEALISE